jgi:magnesium chelatase subunit D
MSPFDPHWESSPYDDGILAAALLAIDPIGLGGILVRTWSGPARDSYLHHLQTLFPKNTKILKMPASISDEQLNGGLDLSATLQAQKPVYTEGLLARAQNHILHLAMAERLEETTAARLTAALDNGTPLTLIALDEGATPDEAPPSILTARLAFTVQTLPGTTTWPAFSSIARARKILPDVIAGEEAITKLTQIAAAFGILPLRPLMFAWRTARAAAALRGGTQISDADIEIAARLSLLPYATQIPSEPEAPSEAPEPDPGERQESEATQAEDRDISTEEAKIPPGLLEALSKTPNRQARGAKATGRQKNKLRGRPAPSRPGPLTHGARLDLLATIRAAAPWQRLRNRQTSLRIRPEDFRLRKYKQRAVQTVIFAVDASGSAAINRLGEAKGAIQLLLAAAYARRDEVALIAFRGRQAEILLPPTNALARARRSLAALPGGGPTPLAAGLTAAATLATQERRRGHEPLLVFLTDGGANIAADGSPGRAQAAADARDAAKTCKNFSALVVDTAPRPQALLPQLATLMGARYLALPFANANTLAQAVTHAGRP